MEDGRLRSLPRCLHGGPGPWPGVGIGFFYPQETNGSRCPKRRNLKERRKSRKRNRLLRPVSSRSRQVAQSTVAVKGAGNGVTGTAQQRRRRRLNTATHVSQASSSPPTTGDAILEKCLRALEEQTRPLRLDRYEVVRRLTTGLPRWHLAEWPAPGRQPVFPHCADPSRTHGGAAAGRIALWMKARGDVIVFQSTAIWW